MKRLMRGVPLLLLLVFITVFLCACGSGGGGGATTAQSGASAPSAPATVAAISGNSQVTLTWSVVLGAASYNVYWSTTPGVTALNGTRLPTVSSPYIHTNRTNGTTYYYVVTAVNGNRESAASSEASAVPRITPPTGITATPASQQITLAWSPVAGATSYNAYWSTTSGVTKTTGTPLVNISSPYTHTSLTNGQNYYYVITALDSHGESVDSSQAHARPVANPPPAAPSGVSAVPGNEQVTISWPAVPGATSYNVYWSPSSGVTTLNGTKISGVIRPYIHTGLTNGTTYYYVVTAQNGNGESTASFPEVSAIPIAAPFIRAVAFSYQGATAPWSVLTLVYIDNCIDGTPLTNADVTVNGVILPYNASNSMYEGNVLLPVGIPATAVNLSVSVNGSTFTATGTHYTQNPSITALSPPPWDHAFDHTVSWTGGLPTAGSAYYFGVLDAAGAFVYPIPIAGSDGPLEIPLGTTSLIVPANSLTPGSRSVVVGIGTAGLTTGTGGIPIANACAASGSGLYLGAYGTVVPVTVQ